MPETKKKTEPQTLGIKKAPDRPAVDKMVRAPVQKKAPDSR